MKKILLSSVIAMSVSAPAFANAWEQRLRDYTNKVGTGYISDGSTTDRERKCNHQSGLQIITRSGLYSDWKSAVTSVSVATDHKTNSFIVNVNFTCNQKRQQKAGCGGYVEDTKWYDHSGSLKYVVKLAGGSDNNPFIEKPDYQIFIVDSAVKLSGPSICGQSLLQTIRSNIHEVRTFLD